MNAWRRGDRRRLSSRSTSSISSSSGRIVVVVLPGETYLSRNIVQWSHQGMCSWSAMTTSSYNSRRSCTVHSHTASAANLRNQRRNNSQDQRNVKYLKYLRIFTAPCYIAVERYCRRMTSVRPSVCLSVTLIDADDIRWARWNFITWLISPMTSLAARKTSAI